MKPVIGILGGIGPDSSALFYAQLIRNVQLRGQPTSNEEYPHIVLESIPAPELFLENADLTMYELALKNLERSGVDFIVIVCNTAQVYLDQFRKRISVPILDLLAEVEEDLTANKIGQVTVIGSSKTANWIRFKKISINLLSEEDLKMVDEVILDTVLGKNLEESKRKIFTLMKERVSGTPLIACTELSVLLKGSKLAYFDTFDILLEATLQRWLHFKGAV